MAGTNNSWNNQVNGSYNQIILNAGTNGVAISTDNSAATVNVATGGAVKTTTLGSTNSTSTTTVQSGSGVLNITATGGALTINSGTGALGISTDASATTISIGTGGAAKAVTVGSTNTTSALTLNSGSGGIKAIGVASVAVANKNYVTINTSTGALGSDAGASSSITITGDSGGGLTGTSFTFTGGTTGLTFAGAGTTETLGGTLAIANGGTNATSMATSTGIVKYDGTRLVTSSTAKIDSSNRMTNTSQPAFFAYLANATANNVTGDATNYTVLFDTVVFDQASNYNTGTGIFTAPIAGRYYFSGAVLLANIAATHTIAEIRLQTTGQQISGAYINAGICNISGLLMITVNALANMAASDTAKIIVVVSGSTKTVGVNGQAAAYTYFSGNLEC